MEGIKISVSKREYGEDTYVVRVDGFIDTLTAPELERTLGTMVDQGKYNLVIDLAGVDYISSAGWGIFISRIKEIRKNEGDLKLARMSPGVYEVFELLEFDRILRAYDSVEEAEKGFGVAVYSDELPITSSQDSPSSGEKPLDESGSPQAMGREGSVEEKIQEIVKEHPSWGSREIRRVLNTERYGWVRLGWWRTWRILRKLGLHSKQKRREYVQGVN